MNSPTIPDWNQFKLRLKIDLNYSDLTIQRYRYAYFAFVKDYCKRKLCNDPMNCIENGLTAAADDFLNEKISKGQLLRLRRIGFKLVDILQHGKLAWKRIPMFGKKYANTKHEHLLSEFIRNDEGIHASSIIYRDEGIIRQFLLYIEGVKCKELFSLNEQDILDFLKYMKGNRPAGLQSTVSSMKHFFGYLINKGVIKKNLKIALQCWDSPHMKMYGVLSLTEKQLILEAIDRTTKMGKRDFAIFSLVSECGLRSYDICSLCLKDIDWRCSSVSLVQSKTSKPVTLPFSDATGDAIADYILNARGETNLPYVFIKNFYCDTKMSSSLLSYNLKKYMNIAGIHRSPAEKINMHSFRRSLGTELLETGNTLELVSQILGHEGTSATRRYISFTKNALLDCTLDLSLLPDIQKEVHDER